MTMTPDFETAAIRATETLIKYGISSAPVDPLPILKRTPGVLAVSYESMSSDVDQDRRCVMSLFGENTSCSSTTAPARNPSGTVKRSVSPIISSSPAP